MSARREHDVRLVREDDRTDELETLRTSARVGLEAALANPNRTARAVRVAAPAARWGLRWDDEDERTRRWYPQGISTVADGARGDGRDVVCVSWYDPGARGTQGKGAQGRGSRVTFVDLTDRDRIGYRHVLLVDPVVDARGTVSLRPMHVHAGGVEAHGPYLYVAGTRRGVAVFRLDDVLEVPTAGYGYVLPLAFWYAARTGEGSEGLRYSFLSLDGSGPRPHLVAGEYGVNTMSTRLVRFEIESRTALLRPQAGGSTECRPVELHVGGIEHMQGVASVDGTYYVTASAGRFRRGSLWVGRPATMARLHGVLPVGPEDITYRSVTDQLWSVTEHPGRRVVFAMDRGALGR